MPSSESSRNPHPTGQSHEPKGKNFDIAIERAKSIYNQHGFYPYTYREISDTTIIDNPGSRSNGVNQFLDRITTRQLEFNIGHDLGVNPKLDRTSAEERVVRSLRGIFRRFREYRGGAQYQLINLGELLSQLPESPEDRRPLSTVVAPGHPGLAEFAQHLVVKNFIIGGARPVSEMDDPLVPSFSLYLHSDIIDFPDKFAENTTIAETRTGVLEAYDAQAAKFTYWNNVLDSGSRRDTTLIPDSQRTET